MDDKVAIKKTIDPKMPITDLLFLYPEIAEVLTFEYGLYCVNCFIADFDTLEEGAKIHGIDEEDFKKMIKHLESIINSEDDY
jgi:hybrid cluster-associated redox disulfide protein